MLSPKRDIEEMATFPGALMGQPVKSGVVYAVHSVPRGRQFKVRVVLNVYVTNFGRFAVVSQEKTISRDYGFINLKHCTLKAADSPSVDSHNHKDSTRIGLYFFQVIARNAEGKTMTFCVTSQSEVEQWVHTLRGTESVSFQEYPLARTDTHAGKRKIPPRRQPLSELSLLKVAPPLLSRKSQSFLPTLDEE